jgi:hypothetical protein
MGLICEAWLTKSGPPHLPSLEVYLIYTAICKIAENHSLPHLSPAINLLESRSFLLCTFLRHPKIRLQCLPQLNLLYQKTNQEPQPRNPNSNLPNKLQTIRINANNFTPQWILE